MVALGQRSVVLFLCFKFVSMVLWVVETHVLCTMYYDCLRGPARLPVEATSMYHLSRINGWATSRCQYLNKSRDRSMTCLDLALAAVQPVQVAYEPTTRARSNTAGAISS
jgi:hypothetical protein